MRELGYEIAECDLGVQCQIYLDSNDSALLVAETNGRLSGVIAGHVFALIHQAGNIGRITALVVIAAQRGTGVGGSLLKALERWFQQRRCLRFEVTSGEQRETAHRFYQSQGYQREGRRFIKRNSASGAIEGQAVKVPLR